METKELVELIALVLRNRGIRIEDVKPRAVLVHVEDQEFMIGVQQVGKAAARGRQ